MHIARGQLGVGEARLRWSLVFTPRLWCLIVERHGLLLDTRLVPAALEAPRDTVCIHLLLKGRFTIHGAVDGDWRAPTAFQARVDQLEGARGARPFTYAAAGDPFLSVQVYLAESDAAPLPAGLPRPVWLDERSWEVASLAAHARTDDATRQAIGVLLQRLGDGGHVAPEVIARLLDPPSKTFAILWRSLRPMIERLALSPSLKEVGDAAGVSRRQLDRHIEKFVTSFPLVGVGWRLVTRHLRLKLAVLLLSAADATVADVALAVGYRSPDAMARAFRDAGLPAPSAVRQRLHALMAEG